MHHTGLRSVARTLTPALMHYLISLCALALLPGCQLSPVISWPDLPPSKGLDKTRIADARTARAALLADPGDEQKMIWYGRRLGYLGFYTAAIEVYSLGLKVHPGSPKLLRHRGHRRISMRAFDAAVTDFEDAVKVMAGSPDEVEPDGMPNARNTPTSTLHTNIWYHLGLAHYCRGEFETALRCYESCLEAAKNPDMEVAARYWKFLAATRCGDRSAANAAYTGVEANWDIIENHAYHRLLLLFRGDLKIAEFGQISGDEIKNLTAAYGLARYQFIQGNGSAGTAALKRIAAKKSAAFGCIAAQADLTR